MNKVIRDLKKLEQTELYEKLGLYYTTQSLLGHQGITAFWCIGSRGRGKSYSGMDTYLNFVKKYGQENCKCYYFRVSDLSVKAMLENKGRKAIDALLVRKYNLDLTTHGSTLYNHGAPLIDFYALVSAAKKGKGVAEYDPEFLGNRPLGKNGKPLKRFIFVFVDEFMVDETQEKKSVGNPVQQFKIFLENILRDQERLDYDAVKIFGFANSVSECNGFLSQIYGFIPPCPGRFVLKRKHAIVDNIPNSKAYEEKRRNSITADIMDLDNDANYTNDLKQDLETLKPKSMNMIKVTALIKFDRTREDAWFCLYDGRIIRRYRGECVNSKLVVPMKRYLDALYNDEMTKQIIEMYDARAFLFADLISQATFKDFLKEIKKK